MNLRLLTRCLTCSVVLTTLTAPVAQAALEEISDSVLSEVNGADGIEYVLSDTTIPAQRIRWALDTPSGPLGAGFDAFADFETVSYTGVNAAGTATNLPFSVTATVDAGSSAGSATAAHMGLNLSWTRTRFRADALRHGLVAGKSLGALALDASGSIWLANIGSPFNFGAGNGAARITLTDARLYLRQQTSELQFNDLDINLGFTSGKIGFDNTGLRIQSSNLDWNILYDLSYRGAAATAFESTGAVGMLRYGWAGRLKDFDATISGKGIWSGAETNASEGLKIAFRNNYETDFEWIIADPTGVPAMLRFQNWVNLPGVTYSWDVPNLTFDVIRFGGSSPGGPGNIDYLGTPYNVAPDAHAFAIALRDLKFLSYNTKVQLIDTSIGMNQTYDQALIYTIGDADVNLFMYPGGRTAALSDTIRFDLTLAVKSPGAWQTNTHYLIGDTDVNAAFGFPNANFLVTIDNGFLEMTPTGVRLVTMPDADPGTAGNQFPGDFRWKFGATFSGGFLNDFNSFAKGFDLNLNLHASLLDLYLMPPSSGTYIGFQWDAVLVNDSEIKLSEPSQPDVAVTLGQISGPLSVRNGKLDFRAGSETPSDSQPRLVFEQELRFGETSSGVATDVMRFDNFAIGANQIGSIVLPGGKFYGFLALKERP